MKTLDIYTDRFCTICINFGHVVKRIDILNKINQKDLRDYNGKVFSKNKGIEKIASVNTRGKVYYGFNTIYQIALRCPVVWIFIPILTILKISQTGDLIHKKIALNRFIISSYCDKNRKC